MMRNEYARRPRVSKTCNIRFGAAFFNRTECYLNVRFEAAISEPPATEIGPVSDTYRRPAINDGEFKLRTTQRYRLAWNLAPNAQN